MKFKTLLTINATLAFASGIACVLIPGQLLASYGIRLIPMGMVISILGINAYRFRSVDMEYEKVRSAGLTKENCVVPLHNQRD